MSPAVRPARRRIGSGGSQRDSFCGAPLHRRVVSCFRPMATPATALRGRCVPTRTPINATCPPALWQRRHCAIGGGGVAEPFGLPDFLLSAGEGDPVGGARHVGRLVWRRWRLLSPGLLWRALLSRAAPRHPPKGGVPGVREWSGA